jgi:integrase
MTATASDGSLVGAGGTDRNELDVGGYLRQWLAHARGRVRAVTYEGYEALLRRHAMPRIGHLQLRELRPLHIQNLYGELLTGSGRPGGLGAGTVLNLHLVLTQAFAQAVRWQLLNANPAAGAQPPRPRRPPRLLVDPPLLSALLASVAGTWLEAPAAIAAATGMRRGEILGLQWADLKADLTAVQVQRTLQPTRQGLVFEQPKTARSRRTVLLPAFLRPHLERRRAAQAARRAGATDWQEHGLVIDRGDGRPLNPDTLSAGWARHLRRRQLPPVRFHDLRHAHATLMLAQGVHPKVVSERLGHASVGITLDTYSHVLPTLQQEAAAAFDALFTERPAGDARGARRGASHSRR